MGKSKRISPPRWFHQFQLRRDVVFDNHIHEIIGLLNSERAFRQSVIDGIRLIWDLRHMHREDVLLELFPDIVERLQIRLTPPPTPIDPDDIANRVLEKMQEAHQLVVVESPLVASPGIKSVQPALPASTNGNLKGAHAIAMPTFDDDDEKVEKKHVDGGTIAANWVDMMVESTQKLAAIPVSASTKHIAAVREISKHTIPDDDDTALVVKRAVH